MRVITTHSMAMGCKTDFTNMNNIVAKNKMPWNKSNLDNHNLKQLKTVPHYGKNNNDVRNKHLRHNSLSSKPHVSSKRTTSECMNKRKPSGKSNKMLALRSNKNGGTGHESLGLHAKHIKQRERLRTLLHAKSDIAIVTMMKNNATASSSSPYPSSPEAPIPKNISHGH
jgi:hypothetical protein